MTELDHRLDALPGLRTAKTLIRQFVTADEGGHALLLYGSHGRELRELAQILIRHWLSQDGSLTDRPIAAMERGNNPDVRIIEPDGRSALITMDQVKGDKWETDLGGKYLRTAPLYSRHKVIAFFGADRMNASVANAILKLLEEPPPYARFILTTTEIGRVLPTIRSRCIGIAGASETTSQLRAAYPDATEDELALADGSRSEMEFVRSHRETFQALSRWADEVNHLPPAAALALADRFLEWADDFGKRLKLETRVARTEGVGYAVRVLRNRPALVPGLPHLAQAHKQIQENGHASIVMDFSLHQLLIRRSA